MVYIFFCNLKNEKVMMHHVGNLKNKLKNYHLFMLITGLFLVYKQCLRCKTYGYTIYN